MIRNDWRPPALRHLLSASVGLDSHLRRNHRIQLRTSVAVHNDYLTSLYLLQHFARLLVSPNYGRRRVQNKYSGRLAPKLQGHDIPYPSQGFQRYGPGQSELQVHEQHLRFNFAFLEHVLSHVKHYEARDPYQKLCCQTYPWYLH